MGGAVVTAVVSWTELLVVFGGVCGRLFAGRETQYGPAKRTPQASLSFHTIIRQILQIIYLFL